MVEKRKKAVVLLAIKPRFAEAIMKGEKDVEFRKVLPRDLPQTIVVYASSPIQRVLGFFEVAFVDAASPEELWRRYGKTGCISQDEYQQYYGARESGVAIGVGRVHELLKQQPLSQVYSGTHPPQSFVYLSEESLSKLPARKSRRRKASKTESTRATSATGT